MYLGAEVMVTRPMPEENGCAGVVRAVGVAVLLHSLMVIMTGSLHEAENRVVTQPRLIADLRKTHGQKDFRFPGPSTDERLAGDDDPKQPFRRHYMARVLRERHGMYRGTRWQYASYASPNRVCNSRSSRSTTTCSSGKKASVAMYAPR